MNSTHSVVGGGPAPGRPASRFISVTRTTDEISIAVDEPIDYELSRHGVEVDPSKKGDWRCIAVKGPMELCELNCVKLLPLPLGAFCADSSYLILFAFALTWIFFFYLFSALTGILSDLTAPLKAAHIPIFVLSTWYVLYIFSGDSPSHESILTTFSSSSSSGTTENRNTDYLLVPFEKSDEAVQVLKNDAWTFPDDVHAWEDLLIRTRNTYTMILQLIYSSYCILRFRVEWRRC